MAFEIRRGDLKTPRRWQRMYTVVSQGRTKQVVYISCPYCGRRSSLTGNRLNGSGMITRLMCPYKPCDFSAQNVQLVGWSETP